MHYKQIQCLARSAIEPSPTAAISESLFSFFRITRQD
jgi:hypothetical protein